MAIGKTSSGAEGAASRPAGALGASI